MSDVWNRASELMGPVASCRAHIIAQPTSDYKTQKRKIRCRMLVPNQVQRMLVGQARRALDQKGLAASGPTVVRGW